MAGTNRHYIPQFTWHITHKFRKNEYLLKFGKNKRTYLGNTEYESKWSESIAVGTKNIIDLVMEKLGFRVSGIKIEKERSCF